MNELKTHIWTIFWTKLFPLFHFAWIHDHTLMRYRILYNVIHRYRDPYPIEMFSMICDFDNLACITASIANVFFSIQLDSFVNWSFFFITLDIYKQFFINCTIVRFSQIVMHVKSFDGIKLHNFFFFFITEP